MQLYAVALAAPGATAPDVSAAVRSAAAPFEQLDPEALQAGRSPSGRLAWAALAHAPEQAGPRRYAAFRETGGVLLDGFPVDRDGRFAAHDAAALLDRWDDAFGELEGLFTAVRVDLAQDAVEALTDVLGMAPLFAWSGGGLTVVANTVAAIRAVTGVSEPDELGVGSMLALGWPHGGRSLLAGVRLLPGGTLRRFAAEGESERVFLSPETVAEARPPSIDEVEERMRTSARTIAGTGVPVTSAVSSGRDTRLLLALLLGSGIDADYYTSGVPRDPDVVIGRQLAERFGLRHQVHPQVAPADGDRWRQVTTALVRRNDGLASVESMNDHLDHEGPAARLGVEFWGAGGEIGRLSWGWYTQPLGGIVPGLKRSWRVQRTIIARMLDRGDGLLTPAAIEPVEAYLDEALAAYRAAGWEPRQVFSLDYAFGRVRWWAGRGVRRAAATTDLYGPFITRSYIEHALRLTPNERWTEQPHRQLIARLRPEVDTVPYEVPWRPHLPRLAFPMHVAETAWYELRDRLPTEPVPYGPAFGPIWFEAGLPLHRELARSVPDSPLWRFVDRARYLALLDGPPEQRAPVSAELVRALTLLWYFHAGDAATPA